MYIQEEARTKLNAHEAVTSYQHSIHAQPSLSRSSDKEVLWKQNLLSNYEIDFY